jgi:hypothetical protein
MHTTYFLSATKWGAVRATGFPWHLDTVLYKRGEERDGGGGGERHCSIYPERWRQTTHTAKRTRVLKQQAPYPLGFSVSPPKRTKTAHPTHP